MGGALEGGTCSGSWWVTGGLGLELCLRLGFSRDEDWGVGGYVAVSPRSALGGVGWGEEAS